MLASRRGVCQDFARLEIGCLTDVSPIRGVILGGGARSLRVHVDVVRLADGESGRPEAAQPGA